MEDDRERGTWDREAIEEIRKQLNSTVNFWPKNPIPLRAKLRYHCSNKSPNGYPCGNCNEKYQLCLFRRNDNWKPIVLVWQLEYLIPHEVRQLTSFLRNHDDYLRDGYISQGY